MKINEATKAQKVQAMASIEGLSLLERECSNPNSVWTGYLHDLNTIHPVIRRLDSMQFIRFCSELVGKTTPFDSILTLDKARAFFFATPEELVDCVLVAAGKFEPEDKKS